MPSRNRHRKNGDCSRSSPPPILPLRRNFPVQVQFEDSSSTDTILVRAGESILSALERAASAQGWSEVPSDCRRGKCLTCTARHANESNRQHIQPLSDNGLSPALTIGSGEPEEQDESYFLTCRSTVTGPGVALRVSLNSVEQGGRESSRRMA